MESPLWLATLGDVGATLTLIILAANLGLMLGVLGLQVRVARSPRTGGRRAERPDASPLPLPFVSIHLPISNEPPEVVARTLEALARQQHRAFEVIVLDNNTTDRRLWEPVQRTCEALGPQFRFFHRDQLEGAKSGALNLCLELTDARAELIAVVDADYEVAPGFLIRAWAYSSDPGVSFVQFPQAYRNASGRSAGLTDELAHYFDAFMRYANATDSVLLTGTLSVLRKDALVAVGGWATDCITEDAELGVRLQARGFRGRYAEEIVGHGLMPGNLRELRKQRRRWVYGNAQALGSALPLLSSLGRRRALGVVAQLTAWFNFLLVPGLALVASVPFQLVRPSEGTHRIAVLAGVSLLVGLLGKLWVLAAVRPGIGGAARRPIRVLATHLGTVWEGATAWPRSLGGRLGFERTSKFGGAGSFADTALHLLGATLFLGTAIVHGWSGDPFAALGAALGALSFAAVMATRRELRGATEPVRVSSPHSEPVSRPHSEPVSRPRPGRRRAGEVTNETLALRGVTEEKT